MKLRFVKRSPEEGICNYMNGLKTSVSKSARQLAQDTAKQIAKEPLELEKTALRQVGLSSSEKKDQQDQLADNEYSKAKEQDEQQKRVEAKMQSLRQAFESELKDIRREKVFQELLQKISEGEVVNLADYNELTWEQKQVLHAQKLALQNRKSKTDQNHQDLSEPGAKRKKNLFAGVKTRLARVQRKSEIRMPPTG